MKFYSLGKDSIAISSDDIPFSIAANSEVKYVSSSRAKSCAFFA